MGYVWWGCRCLKCRTWNRERSRDQRARREWNLKVIQSLFYLAPRENPLPILESADSLPKNVLTDFEEFIPVPVQSEPESEPEPEPVTEPIPVQPPRETLEGVEIPNIISSLHDQMTVPLVREISDAYFKPEWTSTLPDGVQKRVHGDMEIKVGTRPGAPVISFARRSASTAPEPEAKPKPRGIPKAKGGRGGRPTPTSIKALIAALKARGCDVQLTGSGHWEVTRDGKRMILPSTASDWRSVKNSLAQARKDGLM